MRQRGLFDIIAQLYKNKLATFFEGKTNRVPKPYFTFIMEILVISLWNCNCNCHCHETLDLYFFNIHCSH